MNNEILKQAKDFKKKYPYTVAWRLASHAKVIEKHLNPGEEVLYVFPAQKSETGYEIFTTYLIVLTNKRIMIGTKRVVFGYLFKAVTPELFNDLTVSAGLIWGTVCIDTVKETIYLSNIDKKALSEIETNITEYMMEEKRKYPINEKKDK